MPDLASLHLEEEEIGIAGELTEALGDDPPSVRRDRMDAEVAAKVEGALPPSRQFPSDDLEVSAVAAVRRVHEQRAVARDDRRPMVEARVDDERLRLAAPLHEIQLRPLVAARIDGEQDTTVRKQPPIDRFRQISELLRLAALERQEEELPDSRQVGSDQQPRSVLREPERPRLPELEERAQIPQRPEAIDRARPGYFFAFLAWRFSFSVF